MAGWHKSYGGNLLHLFKDDGTTMCGKKLTERVNPQIPATGKCKKCEKAAQQGVQLTRLRRPLELCSSHDIHYVGTCPICDTPRS